MKIKVNTKSNEQKVEKKGDFYLVKLKSLPKDGKANAELLKVLKKHFKKGFKIKSGFTSRNKVVEEV